MHWADLRAIFCCCARDEVLQDVTDETTYLIQPVFERRPYVDMSLALMITWLAPVAQIDNWLCDWVSEAPRTFEYDRACHRRVCFTCYQSSASADAFLIGKWSILAQKFHLIFITEFYHQNAVKRYRVQLLVPSILWNTETWLNILPLLTNVIIESEDERNWQNTLLLTYHLMTMMATIRDLDQCPQLWVFNHGIPQF